MGPPKGRLVDIDGRLKTRQWDDDAGKAAEQRELFGS